MAKQRFSLVTWLLFLAALIAGPPALAEQNHIVPKLIAESSRPAAGRTVTLAIAMTPEPGWHGYWSNPGEAGFEPRFAWHLPKGAAAGAPRFPVPQPLLISGLMNYVYEGPHALLLPLAIPANLAPGSALPIRLDIDYLACTDQVCVPQRAALSLDLAIGDGAVDPQVRARFDGWRARLPMPLAAPAHFERSGDRLRLAIPYPAAASLGDAHFFPAKGGVLTDAAPQTFERAGDSVVATLVIAKGATSLGSVEGVLALGTGQGLTIAAVPGPVPETAPPASGLATALLALGGAILGGLILNVMPCVFPILSLKALSLAKAGGGEGAARRDALGYTLGAVLVCVGLGAAILALRAGGSSVGWAFQLQDPRVIVALLVLMTAISLNLAGLFELPTVAGGAAGGNSIATGALAAFVATPCTGPFMGAALGAALVLPTAAALAVFAGLGFGLALPFLLLGFVPALRKVLPRPGAWMATMRRVLSAPMFLTALGLGWLLGRQAGSDALAIGLAAALAAGLALWWVGLRQMRGRAGLTLGALVAVAATALAIIALPPPGSAPAASAAGDPLKFEPFSEARLAALRAERRPVFVYFTADWCLTCKVNERVAIDQPEVAAAFAKAGVATLVGDWTRSDPVIGRFLESQGRSGVPLYLYYRPGAAAPDVLPQVLTPGGLVEMAS